MATMLIESGYNIYAAPVYHLMYVCNLALGGDNGAIDEIDLQQNGPKLRCLELKKRVSRLLKSVAIACHQKKS